MDSYEYISQQDNQRLDAFAAARNETLSRSAVQKLISSGHILVNGKNEKANYRLKNGDRVSVNIPEPEPLDIRAENIPLDILYEDEHIIVINKKRGMIVHPAPGIYTGTLVNALLHHCRDLSGINGVIRPRNSAPAG